MVLHQSWLQRLKSKKDEPSSVTVTNQTASAALTPDDSTFSAVRDGEQPNEMASKSDEKTCASTTCLSEKGNNTVKTTDELQYLQPQALVVVMIALLLACLLMALDMSIVSTAIPRITDEFDTLADIGWYGSAYLLTCAALQPLTGKFYTYFLLKHAFFSFLGLFELGSVIAGAATSSKMLVIGRAVSGLGGAGLMNGCLTIVGVATSEKQRPMLMGIIMAFFGTGQLIGPLIGGALTEHASWRWCFYLNLPVGAATCLCLAFIHLPGQKRQPMQRNAHFIIRKFDLLGFCLFAPACIMVLLAMEWGGVHYTWSSATIIGLLCGSGGAFAVFGYWEYRASEDAMIPVDMISRRVIWTAVLTSAFQGGGIIMLGYYLPLFFQVVQHASPTASAVRILPTMIGQVVFAAISGAIGIFSPFSNTSTLSSSLTNSHKNSCEDRLPHAICSPRLSLCHHRLGLAHHTQHHHAFSSVDRVPSPSRSGSWTRYSDCM